MLKKILTSSALILLGIILALVILEIEFRWLDQGMDLFVEPHPLFGWFNIPGKSGIHAGTGYRTKIKINAQGLRDNEHALAKPPGTYRIIVLGDSCMEAMQVPLEKSFPKQLETMLNHDAGGKKVEVINFGCLGFGTDQEYLTLKYLGAQYKPDLVILTLFPGNDVRDNYFNTGDKPHFKINARGELVPQPFVYKPSSRMLALMKKSRVITTVLLRWGTRSPKISKFISIRRVAADEPAKKFNKYDVYARAYNEDWQAAWNITLALIKQTKKLAEEQGAKFLLVSLTAQEQLELEPRKKEVLANGFDLERQEKNLLVFSHRQGIEYIPLFYYFRDYIKEHNIKTEDLHIPRDYHWTARGHEIAAAWVKEKIKPQLNAAGIKN